MSSSLPLFVVFFISFLILATVGQVYDPYRLVSPGFTSNFYYNRPEICDCPATCAVNPSTLSYFPIGIGALYIHTVSDYNVTANISQCSPIIVETDHTTRVLYSFDNVTWVVAKRYICPMYGKLHIRLTNMVYTNPIKMQWQLYNPPNCTYTSLISENVTGTKVYQYNTTDTRFGAYLDTNCSTPLNLSYYSTTDPVPKVYSMPATTSHFAIKSAVIDTYYITITIDGKSGCDVKLYYTNKTTSTRSSTPYLFVNGVQSYGAIFFNNGQYNMTSNINVTVYGNLTTTPDNATISNMNNTAAYTALTNGVFEDSSYFDPLRVYYGVYDNQTIVLNDTFVMPPTGEINFTNTIINITVANITGQINLVNTTVFILNTSFTVTNLTMSGNNTINIGNGTVLVSNTLVVTGSLTIDGLIMNMTDKNVSIFNYVNISGQFDEVLVKTNMTCYTSTPQYKESQFLILFKVKEECVPQLHTYIMVPGPSGESIWVEVPNAPNNLTNATNATNAPNAIDQKLLYIIVFPIIGAIILIVFFVVLVLKVPALRNRIMPYRDRENFVPQIARVRSVRQNRSRGEYTVQKRTPEE